MVSFWLGLYHTKRKKTYNVHLRTVGCGNPATNLRWFHAETMGFTKLTYSNYFTLPWGNSWFLSYVSLPEGIAENWDFDPVWGYHGDNGEGLSLLSSPWLQSGNSHVPWKIKPDHFPTKEGWSSPHAERTLQKPDSEECPLNDDGMTTAETDKGRYGMIIQMARWPMFCRCTMLFLFWHGATEDHVDGQAMAKSYDFFRI